MRGLDTNWKNDSGVKTFASKLLPRVIHFEEAVNEIMQKTAYVERLLHDIKDCETKEINLKLKDI